MYKSMKQIVLNADNPDLIITPKLNEYYLENGGKIEKWALERVMEELGKEGRKRSDSFSASSAGQCKRKQEFGFIGAPQAQVLPGWQFEVFDLGTWIHAMTQAKLLSAKILEEIEVPLKWLRYLSLGTADGRGYVWWDHPKYHGREFIFEAKSVSARTWDKMVETTKEEHEAQMTRYCLVSGIDLAVYMMIDKGHWTGGKGWHEVIFEPTKEQLEASKAELEELNEAAKNKQLHDMLPECKLKLGNWNYCAYGKGSSFCPKARSWEDAEEKTREQKV